MFQVYIISKDDVVQELFSRRQRSILSYNTSRAEDRPTSGDAFKIRKLFEIQTRCDRCLTVVRPSLKLWFWTFFLRLTGLKD